VAINIVGTGVMGRGQGEFQLLGKTEQCMMNSFYISRLWPTVWYWNLKNTKKSCIKPGKYCV